jgi:hypothetical protein
MEIWQEAPRDTPDGMADRVAFHWTLATNSTYSAHFNEPPWESTSILGQRLANSSLVV